MYLKWTNVTLGELKWADNVKNMYAVQNDTAADSVILAESSNNCSANAYCSFFQYVSSSNDFDCSQKLRHFDRSFRLRGMNQELLETPKPG